MSTEEITSWGMFPTVTAEVVRPDSPQQLRQAVKNIPTLIPRGNGRSYGDSALANAVVCSNYRDHLLQLDRRSCSIIVQAGTTMDNLLQFLIPRGFFPAVVPGTKYISIGGAVASDIHGKNHHKVGTFADNVKSISVILATGEKMRCSRETNADLFRATCGGMGLTGFIDEVEFNLHSIRGNAIVQTSHRAKNLDELFDLFERYESSTYSVAWIDCLQTGAKMGRGIVMSGEHETSGALSYKNAQLPIPVPSMPNWILNAYSIRAFNELYYRRQFKKIQTGKVSMDAFFFPLDKLKSWNNLYGKNGFTQYQVVVPKLNGREGIATILQKISSHQNASFLAVLKLFGKQNQNYLSFPMEGYTLALDFKITPELFDFLHQLNDIVIAYGGRVYLTKDVCMTKSHFEKMYGNNIALFQSIREKYQVTKFQSVQSKRLGL